MLTREKHRHRADITLHARGEQFLHGVGDGRQLGDVARRRRSTRLAQQAQKLKGKWQERKRRSAVKARADAGEAVARPPPASGRGAAPSRARARRACRASCAPSRQTIKPMSVDDAAREVEAGGDGVVVFRNAETAADQRAVPAARTAS